MTIRAWISGYRWHPAKSRHVSEPFSRLICCDCDVVHIHDLPISIQSVEPIPMVEQRQQVLAHDSRAASAHSSGHVSEPATNSAIR